MYPKEMHTHKYVKLEKYTLFITLDIYINNICIKNQIGFNTWVKKLR